MVCCPLVVCSMWFQDELTCVLEKAMKGGKGHYLYVPSVFFFFLSLKY